MGDILVRSADKAVFDETTAGNLDKIRSYFPALLFGRGEHYMLKEGIAEPMMARDAGGNLLPVFRWRHDGRELNGELKHIDTFVFLGGMSCDEVMAVHRDVQVEVDMFDDGDGAGILPARQAFIDGVVSSPDASRAMEAEAMDTHGLGVAMVESYRLQQAQAAA